MSRPHVAAAATVAPYQPQMTYASSVSAVPPLPLRASVPAALHSSSGAQSQSARRVSPLRPRLPRLAPSTARSKSPSQQQQQSQTRLHERTASAIVTPFRPIAYANDTYVHTHSSSVGDGTGVFSVPAGGRRGRRGGGGGGGRALLAPVEVALQRKSVPAPGAEEEKSDAPLYPPASDAALETIVAYLSSPKQCGLFYAHCDVRTVASTIDRMVALGGAGLDDSDESVPSGPAGPLSSTLAESRRVDVLLRACRRLDEEGCRFESVDALVDALDAQASLCRCLQRLYPSAKDAPRRAAFRAVFSFLAGVECDLFAEAPQPVHAETAQIEALLDAGGIGAPLGSLCAAAVAPAPHSVSSETPDDLDCSGALAILRDLNARGERFDSMAALASGVSAERAKRTQDRKTARQRREQSQAAARDRLALFFAADREVAVFFPASRGRPALTKEQLDALVRAGGGPAVIERTLYLLHLVETECRAVIGVASRQMHDAPAPAPAADSSSLPSPPSERLKVISDASVLCSVLSQTHERAQQHERALLSWLNSEQCALLSQEPDDVRAMAAEAARIESEEENRRRDAAGLEPLLLPAPASAPADPASTAVFACTLPCASWLLQRGQAGFDTLAVLEGLESPRTTGASARPFASLDALARHVAAVHAENFRAKGKGKGKQKERKKEKEKAVTATATATVAQGSASTPASPRAPQRTGEKPPSTAPPADAAAAAGSDVRPASQSTGRVAASVNDGIDTAKSSRASDEKAASKAGNRAPDLDEAVPVSVAARATLPKAPPRVPQSHFLPGTRRLGYVAPPDPEWDEEGEDRMHSSRGRGGGGGGGGGAGRALSAVERMRMIEREIAEEEAAEEAERAAREGMRAMGLEYAQDADGDTAAAAQDVSCALSASSATVSTNANAEGEWFYLDDQTVEQGPFPTAVMRRWAMEGALPPELRVRSAGEEQWGPMGERVELLGESPPPTPSHQLQQATQLQQSHAGPVTSHTSHIAHSSPGAVVRAHSPHVAVARGPGSPALSPSPVVGRSSSPAGAGALAKSGSAAGLSALSRPSPPARKLSRVRAESHSVSVVAGVGSQPALAKRQGSLATSASESTLRRAPSTSSSVHAREPLSVGGLASAAAAAAEAEAELDALTSAYSGESRFARSYLLHFRRAPSIAQVVSVSNARDRGSPKLGAAAAPGTKPALAAQQSIGGGSTAAAVATPTTAALAPAGWTHSPLTLGGAASTLGGVPSSASTSSPSAAAAAAPAPTHRARSHGGRSHLHLEDDPDSVLTVEEIAERDAKEAAEEEARRREELGLDPIDEFAVDAAAQPAAPVVAAPAPPPPKISAELAFFASEPAPLGDEFVDDGPLHDELALDIDDDLPSLDSLDDDAF